MSIGVMSVLSWRICKGSSLVLEGGGWMEVEGAAATNGRRVDGK